MKRCRRWKRGAMWAASLSLGLGLVGNAAAETSLWNRFRGPNGTGISTDASPPPTEWTSEKNVRWKIDLPGPGSSSPIVVGDRLFVTCWSGYGTRDSEGGSLEDLNRHLVCVDRKTGKIKWDRKVKAVLPEDTYQGMFAEHGYASHTPTSDGERVYAFFGKSGVIAFDMDGNELWRQEVGDGLDSRRWGSSCSPILYKDLLIVTAAAEKQAIYAFDKVTGKMVWKQSAKGLESTWGTPVLVPVDESRSDLVIGVPFEIWGFDPATGELRWYCTGPDTDSFCSSVVASGSTIYAVEGRSGGSIAIRAGGKDDITKTNVLWTGTDRGRIATPVVFQDRLFFFSGGIANCLDAKTGKEVFQARLRRDLGAEPAPSTDSRPDANAGRGDFRRRGGGGPGGGQDYASPIIAGGVIYHQARNGDVYVVQPADELKQIAVNRVSQDSDEDFSATPAAVEGTLYIRSSKRLYCIGH